MPLYEYKCSSCGNHFDVLQKFSDEPLTVHDGCGGTVERLVSAPAFHFKGTGWYVTDYAKSNGKSPKSTDSENAGSAPKSGESGTSGESSGKEAKENKEKKADGGGKAESKSTSTTPSVPAPTTGGSEKK